MTDRSVSVDPNGNAALNMAAAIGFGISVLLVLHQLAIYFDWLPPDLRLGEFLENGWTIVIVSAIALILWGLGAPDTFENEASERQPDPWIGVLVTLTLAVFVVSLLWNIAHYVVFVWLA